MVTTHSPENNSVPQNEFNKPLDPRTATLLAVALGVPLSQFADAHYPTPKPHPYATEPASEGSNIFSFWKEHPQVMACEASIRLRFLRGLHIRNKHYFLMNVTLTGVRGGCKLGASISDLVGEQIYLEFEVDKTYTKKDIVEKIFSETGQS